MELNKVEIEDLNHLSPYFSAQSHPLSAYLLPGLIAWAECAYFNVRYLIEADHVWFVAHCSEEPAKSHLLLPIGGNGVPPQELAVMVRRFEVPEVWFVPSAYLNQYGDEVSRYFELLDHPEYDDYIYGVDDLADLAGGRYAKKRNLIAQFDKEFSLTGRVATSEITESDVDDCLNFLERWCIIRNCGKGLVPTSPAEDAMLQCEKAALQLSLHNANRLGWRGLLVRIDGVVEGLGLWAPFSGAVAEGMAVLSFEKAFAGRKGLYQFLDRECARKIRSQGFSIINKESDMGDAGLRQAKHSYFPKHIEKSMRLRLLP